VFSIWILCFHINKIYNLHECTYELSCLYTIHWNTSGNVLKWRHHLHAAKKNEEKKSILITYSHAYVVEGLWKSVEETMEGLKSEPSCFRILISLSFSCFVLVCVRRWSFELLKIHCNTVTFLLYYWSQRFYKYDKHFL